MEASLPDINYDIIHIDEMVGQIVVQVSAFPAPFTIDLPIDDNGDAPEGAELDTYIRGFIPVWEIERREKVSQGIRNIEALRDLVKPLPPPEPPPPPEPLPLKEHAAFRRWETEVGGITVSGIPLYTDDRSKTLLMGARLRAQSDPDLIERWTAADGNVYPLTSAQIIGLSDAVAAHVSACFGVFADVVAGIDDGSITTHDEIDALFAEISQ